MVRGRQLGDGTAGASPLFQQSSRLARVWPIGRLWRGRLMGRSRLRHRFLRKRLGTGVKVGHPERPVPYAERVELGHRLDIDVPEKVQVVV